jgi:hypothetical protein
MKKLFNQPINTFFIVGFLLLISACAVPSLVIKINTSQDQQARFGQYRTYAWFQPEPVSAASRGGPADYSQLQSHLQKAIEQEIEKKGLRKEADQPQVLLAFDVSLPKPSPSQTYPEGFGYGLAWQRGFRYDYGHANIANYQPVNTYAPGTILIDVIDATTRQLIWRGWAETVLENFNADYKTVVNYVDDIIDKYPAGTLPRP